MGLVVVGGIEKALLVGALLGGDGCRDRAAQGMQALGGAIDKLAVAVAVEGVNVLEVDVQAVVVLLPDLRGDIVQQPRLHPLVGEDGVGKVGGKAARLAEVRDSQQRRGLARVGRLYEPLVRDGAQLPLGGDAVREGAERGKVRHGLRQYRLPDRGVDIGVDLDLLPHVLGRAGDQKALADDKARGVRDLVEARQLLHRGSEAARDGVKTVPRPDNIDLHNKQSSFPKRTVTSVFRKGAGFSCRCRRAGDGYAPPGRRWGKGGGRGPAFAPEALPGSNRFIFGRGIPFPCGGNVWYHLRTFTDPFQEAVPNWQTRKWFFSCFYRRSGLL